MAIIKVYSQDRTQTVDVNVENISDEQYKLIQKDLIKRLAKEQAYQAIANSYTFALTLSPKANPSDLWQHVIYRTYIDSGKNDQSWKRASGQGFEVAFVQWYNSHLIGYGIRLVVLSQVTAVRVLNEMKLTGKISPSKMDIAIEGNCSNRESQWKICGVIHAKTSIAERIKDDAPASKVIMDAGFLSLGVTLDSKSFPPPHGNGVNHGELGGRMVGRQNNAEQPKRNYFEIDGDFNNGYSYNLRTPPSPEVTASGSRIKTLSFNDVQPDQLVSDIVAFWEKSKEKICAIVPETSVLEQATYLSLAQINGHLSAKQKLAQGMD